MRATTRLEVRGFLT